MDGSEYGSGNLMVPYGNQGSGHSGNESSRDRQLREDASGLTKQRQTAALEAVTAAAAEGITSGELENLLHIGHGQASSALSHLHRAGRIKRIKDRRMTQELYVLAEHIGERKESPYNPRVQRKHPKHHSDRTVLEAMKAADIAPTRYDSIRKFLEALP
jgi:hypothetical protein